MLTEYTTLPGVEVSCWGKDVVHGGGRGEWGPGLECVRVHIIQTPKQPEIAQINLG